MSPKPSLSVLLRCAMLLGASALTSAAVAADGYLTLITPEEAHMKDAPIRLLGERSGSRGGGPAIELISPDPGHAHSVPVPIKVVFRPRQGATVDLASLSVIYVKWIDIDITDRVRDYATAQGIDVPQAELPPGKHTIQISISDTKGRSSEKLFTVRLDKARERLGRPW